MTSCHDRLNSSRTINRFMKWAGRRESLKPFKRSAIKIALDTGFNRAITQVILDRLGWSESPLIDATICSDEVRQGRPHPDMIFALMARLGIDDARRVAKVGDTPADLQEEVLSGPRAGPGFLARPRKPHPCRLDRSRGECDSLPAARGIGVAGWLRKPSVESSDQLFFLAPSCSIITSVGNRSRISSASSGWRSVYSGQRRPFAVADPLGEFMRQFVEHVGSGEIDSPMVRAPASRESSCSGSP